MSGALGQYGPGPHEVRRKAATDHPPVTVDGRGRASLPNRRSLHSHRRRSTRRVAFRPRGDEQRKRATKTRNEVHERREVHRASAGVLQAAQSIAMREGHPQFTPEHVLKALLDDPQGLASGLIDRSGGDARQVLRDVDNWVGKLPRASGDASQPQATRGLMRLFDAAEKEAQRAGDSFVTTERLLGALVADREGEAGAILMRAGVATAGIDAAIAGLRKSRTADTATAENGYDALKKYARDLTEAARDGKLDPVIGRDEEIRRTIQVLSRRTKNNPGADRRAGRRQDCDRRGAGAAHRQRRRAREPSKEKKPCSPSTSARSSPARSIRGEFEERLKGSAQRGHLAAEGQHHPVHRRDAHAGRRGQGGRGDGRLEPVEARARPRRTALRGRHHARRVPQARREGRGPGAPLPAGVRVGADRGGHGLDPARAQGEIRAAPRGAHPGFGAGGGGHALEPLHHRPLPAGQGDRPDGRGRLAPAHAGRFEAGRAGFDRPRDRPPQDRRRGASRRRPDSRPPATGSSAAGEGVGRTSKNNPPPSPPAGRRRRTSSARRRDPQGRSSTRPA